MNQDDRFGDPQPTRRGTRTGLKVALVAAGMAAGAIGTTAIAASATTSASTPPGTAGSTATGSSTGSSTGSATAPSGAPDPHGHGGPRGGGPGGSAPVRDDEKSVSTTIEATLKAAALKAVPGGTVIRVETDSGDAAYEVHMKKADGSLVTVKFDKNLAQTAVEDGMGK